MNQACGSSWKTLPPGPVNLVSRFSLKEARFY
jgi:hypothetical protein